MASGVSRPGELLEPHRALDDYLTGLLQESPDGPSAEPGIVPEPPTGEPGPDSALAAWAYPKFQAQLFKVGRLRLALPVIKLHAVVPWCDGIQAQPNQPSWCHGLLSYQGREVRVIDTATLVLPADRTMLMGHDREGFILIVGDGCWGLACHGVEEVMSLAWDEVKWRSRRGRRRWLAGTVLERMCAVLDIDALTDLVGSGSSHGS